MTKAKTIREGFYEFLASLEQCHGNYPVNLRQLKIWADAAFAEADFKNSFALKELISFANDIDSNYDHEEDYHRDGTADMCCRRCKAEQVLRVVEECSIKL